MKILPVAALALFGTSLPLAAQTMKLPVSLTGRDVPVRTQEYETVAQPDAIDGTTQATNLKFKRDDHDRMTVPVRVAGYGPYRFPIDTGADRTAISSDLARQLSLGALEFGATQLVGQLRVHVAPALVAVTLSGCVRA